ncbi:carbohydrate ABC transporter permease [Kribbella sandramycini]|uniref:Carbohydrate ABC transporter permease n=1 Tax=Kribbella sandramycini TaxID=60450 RepID=A0A7Y4NZG6_9ACTN|nr:carbohydrate ABC transporter permease [Kribbella sandramycini]MBB6569328.1 multiple sugar transport system permease protein [Kribbella sandramycini]NOL40833.1 carbohydrate ABC transporter permease [Kribbella sandramycini]
MSHERGIISIKDRQRTAVRIGLPIIQVLLFIGVLVAGVGPLLWLLKSGVSTSQDILSGPMQLWPSGIQWRNIPDAWNRVQIGSYLGNTAIIAIGSMISTLFVCTTGAFVLSVLRPKWGPVVTAAVLATLFLPGVISLVPLYMTILKMPVLGVSLQNTFWAVWLPSAAGAFNVLVMKRYFDSIPRELIEAARIDGASNLRMFTALILPLSKPIVGVVALLTVIGSWKDYLWPLLVLPDPRLQPISVALPRVAKTTEISLQMSALFLAVLIPVVLFLVFQKQFLKGVGMSGGIKE